jgi:hypothetical protein
MQDLWCHILQSSQQTPLQSHVTGRSQIAHGYTFLLVGLGFSSISPDNIITRIMRGLFWVCLDNTVSRDLWLINVHSVAWNKSSDGIRGLITLMCVATVIKVRSNSKIDAAILDSKQCNKAVYWGWIPALTKRNTTYYTRIMKIFDFRVLLSIKVSILM